VAQNRTRCHTELSLKEFFDPIVLQKAFGNQLQGTFNVKR
jgi:hypothetical protein